MTISERIISIRKAKGITQTFIANKLEMDRGNFSKLEKRGEKMTVEQLQSIADALEVSVNELLGSEDKAHALNSENVERLEKEVGYLKQILKEKETKDLLANTILESLLKELSKYAANDLNVGLWRFKEVKTGEVTELKGDKWRNIETLPNYKKIVEGLKSGDYKEESIYTEEELNRIQMQVIKRDTGALYILNLLGYVKDKELSSRIIELGGGFAL